MQSRSRAAIFFFQAEDGIRDSSVTEFRRVLFRSRLISTSQLKNEYFIINFHSEEIKLNQK